MNPKERALKLAKKVKFTKITESTGRAYKVKKLPKAAYKPGAFYNTDTRKWES